MKKVHIIAVVVILLGVMALSSCRSSKPCQAYRSISSVEYQAGAHQES